MFIARQIFDRIPRDFSQMVLAYQTRLSLPIRSIFVTPENLFKFSSICNQIAVRDIFQFNPQLRIIQRKQQDIAIHHRCAVNKIFRGIHTGRVHINYFFEKHCLPQAINPNTTIIELPQLCFNPLVNCLQFRLPPSKTFRNVTTKTFRKTVSQLNPPPRFLDAVKNNSGSTFGLWHLRQFKEISCSASSTKEFRVSLCYIASCQQNAPLQYAHFVT